MVVGDFSKAQWDRIDTIAFFKDCRNSAGSILTRPTPVAGTAQTDPSGNACFTPEQALNPQALTNKLSGQINPSNTGNLGLQSRFTLTDKLILTVDPTYQYTLANGGSQTALIAENSYLLRQGVRGFDRRRSQRRRRHARHRPPRSSVDHQHQSRLADHLAGVPSEPPAHAACLVHL